MSSNSTNKGDETEDLVEHISSNIALKDFVIRNPKFKKKNGQEKELTDILLPFEDSIISIQAKSKIIDLAKTKSKIAQERIEKAINSGIGQLRNTRLIVDSGETTKFKNVHGIEIPLNSRIVNKIHGIVIANVYGIGSMFNMPSNYIRKHKMPIHIFSAHDFNIISSEVDTIPDLIHYLETREQLFEEKKVIGRVNELDLLATFKTQPEVIDQILEKEGGRLMIAGGTWEVYFKDSRDKIEKRNGYNVPSYFIDETIKEFSKSIGYAPPVTNPTTGLPTDAGTVENYWLAIYQLSKLSRLDRRGFGRKMIEKMKQAAETGIGFTFLKRNEKEGVLFLSSSASRPERVKVLYSLAAMAYVKEDLRNIVAFVTEPLDDSGRSFDLIILDDVDFKNRDEILKASKTTFSKGKQVGGYEYDDIDVDL